MADSFETAAAVGFGKDFALNDASVVAEGDEFHLVTGDQMVGTGGDDKAAGEDVLAG